MTTVSFAETLPTRRSVGRVPRRFAGRVGVLAIVTAASIDLYVQGRYAARTWESRAAAGVLRWLGVHQVQGSFKTYVLVAPKPGALFVSNVTAACSAGFPVLVLAVATLGLIPGRATHRIERFVVAAAIVVVFNIMRLLVVVSVGATHGMAAMAPVHEWLGSAITMLGWAVTVLALFVLVSRQRSRSSR